MADSLVNVEQDRLENLEVRFVGEEIDGKDVEVTYEAGVDVLS